MTALSNHCYYLNSRLQGYASLEQNSNCKYPLALMPLPTQIAGHGSEGDGQRAILKREDGKLLKPVQIPPKGPREASFYAKISQSSDPVDVWLRQHIPKFFGIEKVGFANGITTSEEYLVLEDITDGLIAPSVMDVKIGKKTWGPDATEKKIAQEMSKYTGTKDPFGFSILGMIVHALDPQAPEQVRKFDKSFGKRLQSQEVDQVPQIFFSNGQGTPAELVGEFVEKIMAIRSVLERQRKYKFYASSLLLVYDTHVVRQFKANKLGLDDLKATVKVRLIDFAHAFDANEERDDNLLTGIENLLDLFSRYHLELLAND